MTHWWTGDVDGGTFFVRGDSYHIRTVEKYSWNIRSSEDAGEFADASVSVDIKLTDGTSRAQAGCLRARVEPDAADYSYELCINVDGHSMFGFYPSSGDYVTLSEWASRPGLNPVDQWNNLEIRMADDQFWLFANGQPLDVVSHEGAWQGLVGLSVINGESEDKKAAEWAFRALVVRELR